MDKSNLINAEEIYKYAVLLNLDNTSDSLSETMDDFKSGKIPAKELQIHLDLSRENAVLKTVSELIAKSNEHLLNYLEEHNLPK